MAPSIAASALRTEEKDLRSDLREIRAGSHRARIAVNPSVSRLAAREAKDHFNLSNQTMAMNAGVPESVMSDALNGRGRNLDPDWLLAQGDDYARFWWESVEARKGLTVKSERAVRAARIAELVRLLVEGVA